jgi:hypothetical protein
LILSLAADEHCYANRINQEDAHIASCLRDQGLATFSQPLDVTRIYDDPASNAGWAHEYTNDTLFIHRLKKDDMFLNACYHFMKSDKKYFEIHI